jgi:hypothetical protein
MKTFLTVRAGATCAVAALIMTVGVMAGRVVIGEEKAAPEVLHDAVASPAIPGGAVRSVPLGYFARPGLAKRPVVAVRLDRFADALDARAAALRAQPR